MKIYLLTHPRELDRKSNTGQLALGLENNIVERIVWDRVKPDQALLQVLEAQQALLIYTKGKNEDERENEMSATAIKNFDNIIILDSTWQEAQKMFNKSPYLKLAPRALLEAQQASVYKLRRNQPQGGLCTIECIIEVLKTKGEYQHAAQLSVKFNQFNTG